MLRSPWYENAAGRKSVLTWQDNVLMQAGDRIAAAYAEAGAQLEKISDRCVRTKFCKAAGVCKCTQADRAKAVFHGNMNPSPGADEMRAPVRPKYKGHKPVPRGVIDKPLRIKFMEAVMRSGKTVPQCYLALLANWDTVWAERARIPELDTLKRFLLLAPNTALIENFKKEGLGVVGGTPAEDLEAIELLKTKTICAVFKVPPEVVLAYNKTVCFLDNHTGPEWVQTDYLRAKLANAVVVVSTIQKHSSVASADEKMPVAKRLLTEDSWAACIIDEAHKGMSYPDSPFKNEQTPKQGQDVDAKTWNALFHMYPKTFFIKCSGSRSEEDRKMEDIARATFGEVLEAGRLVPPKLMRFSYNGVSRPGGMGVFGDAHAKSNTYHQLRLQRECPAMIVTIILEAWKVLRELRLESLLPLVLMVHCPNWSIFGGMPQFVDMVVAMIDAQVVQADADIKDGKDVDDLKCAITGMAPRILGTWSKPTGKTAEQMTAAQRNDPNLNLSTEAQRSAQAAIRAGAGADMLCVQNQCTEGYDNAFVKVVLDLRPADDEWNSVQAQMQIQLRGAGTLSFNLENVKLLKSAAWWMVIQRTECPTCEPVFRQMCDDNMATEKGGLGWNADYEACHMCTGCKNEAIPLAEKFVDALEKWTHDKQYCAIVHPTTLDEGGSCLKANQEQWFATQGCVHIANEDRAIVDAEWSEASKQNIERLHAKQAAERAHFLGASDSDSDSDSGDDSGDHSGDSGGDSGDHSDDDKNNESDTSFNGDSGAAVVNPVSKKRANPSRSSKTMGVKRARDEARNQKAHDKEFEEALAEIEAEEAAYQQADEDWLFEQEQVDAEKEAKRAEKAAEQKKQREANMARTKAERLLESQRKRKEAEFKHQQNQHSQAFAGSSFTLEAAKSSDKLVLRAKVAQVPGMGGMLGLARKAICGEKRYTLLTTNTDEITEAEALANNGVMRDFDPQGLKLPDNQVYMVVLWINGAVQVLPGGRVPKEFEKGGSDSVLFDADTEFGKLVAADNAAAAAAAARASAAAPAPAPAAAAATTVGVPVTPTAMVVAQPTVVDYREIFRALILQPPKARGAIGQSAGVMANATHINPCAANIATMQGRLRQLSNPTTNGAYAVNAFLTPLLTTALDIRPRAQDDKEKLARCWAAGWGAHKQEHEDLFVNCGMLLTEELAHLPRDQYDALRKHVTDYCTLYCVSKAHFETVFNAWGQQQSARASSRTAGPALPPLSDFQDATTILSQFGCWDNGGHTACSIQDAVRQIQATVKGTVTAAMTNPGKRNLPSEEHVVKTKQRKVGDRTTIDVVTERVSSFPKIKAKDVEEDQEGDWDHSLKDAYKAVGGMIVYELEKCIVVPNQADGEAYAHSTFRDQDDKNKHIGEVKKIFHVDEGAGDNWGLFPIKSNRAMPNNEADVKGVFSKTLVDAGEAKSVAKNFRSAMHWAARGHGIAKGVCRTGERIPSGINIYDIRDTIRIKQVEIRNAELAQVGGLPPGVKKGDGKDDMKWMAYIRHKFEDRVGALEAFLKKNPTP